MSNHVEEASHSHDRDDPGQNTTDQEPTSQFWKTRAHSQDGANQEPIASRQRSGIPRKHAIASSITRSQSSAMDLTKQPYDDTQIHNQSNRTRILPQYGCMPVALSDVNLVTRPNTVNQMLSAQSRDIAMEARKNSHDDPKLLNPASPPPPSNVLLIMYTLGMLATSVINSLYFKKMTSAMPNYTAFLNQATSVIYIPLFGAVVLYLYTTYGDAGLGGAAVVAFPLYKFAAMGVLDSSASVLMMIGGTYTSGNSQVVLSQVVIPVTLITCYLALNKKYHLYQYIGASIIMLGVLVTKMKSVPDEAAASVTTSDKFAYNAVFMAATIPAAFSCLYKELAFNDVEMNVNYMQFWVALCQFTIGFFLVPMQSLPMLGPQRVPLSEMPASMKDGLLCLVTGHNSIVTNCGGPNQPQCDDCGVAWLPVLNYCLVNIGYNVFSLLVVKHGGATISFLVSTLRIPLTTICFSSVWFMGRGNTTTPSWVDFLGLVILFGGLCCYRYGSLSMSVPSGMKQVHLYTTTLDADPIIMMVPRQKAKSDEHVRNQLYSKLAIVDPLLNPETRAMYTEYKPPQLPREIRDYLPHSMLQRYHEPPMVEQPQPSLSDSINIDHDLRSQDLTMGESESNGVNSPQRESQRQRWLRQLANKYS